MNFLDILRLVNTLPVIIQTVETVKGGGNGKVKREDVRNAVSSSVVTMEAVKQLTVKNRKKFDKALDKIIDGIVEMLNAAEWKAS